jgi:hypothetical protein
MPARTGIRPSGSVDNPGETGDNNVICDRTGFKIKASEGRYEWNGLFVRNESWEPRQPLDFIKGIKDDQRPAVARPGAEDVFIGPGDVTSDDL